MATITVRNLPDDVHRALRVRAANHGRSAEAEVRAILEAATKPQQRLKIGDALATMGRRYGIKDQDLEFGRDKNPAVPFGFDE
jgi:antitoxin FitA